MYSKSIQRDLRMDKYGDISFSGYDIKSTRNENDIVVQNSAHRIMTSHRDLFLHKLYGANLQSFIGRKINQNLAVEIQRSIVDSLTSDNFLNASQLSVIPILDRDKIFFKISVGTTGDFLTNRENELNIVFSPSGGIRYV
jgi:hypothetical protein|nr:MAG TPA: baseplate wedge protein [Bacteriophage sp.]DAY34884.1 MAG TPA: baseplate wedge protein [Bacteriophage sp.]